MDWLIGRNGKDTAYHINRQRAAVVNQNLHLTYVIRSNPLKKEVVQGSAMPVRRIEDT